MITDEIRTKLARAVGGGLAGIDAASRRAADTSAPLLLVVAPGHQLASLAASYRGLEEAGWSIGFAAADQNTAIPEAELCSALRRSAGRAAHTVLDLRGGSTGEALTVAEQAWHAGAMTWMHVGEQQACRDAVHSENQLDLREALDYCDLLSGEFTDRASTRLLSSSGVPRADASDPAEVVRGLSGAGPDPDGTATSRITVVVPSMGDAFALRRCLDSLRGQTLPRNRFDVVIAAASSIDPMPVGDEAADDLTILTAAPVTPASLEAAVTNGIEVATGDYVMLLDEDTVLTPRCLEEHLRAHHAHHGPHTVIAGRKLHRPGEPVSALTRHALRVARPWRAEGPARDGDSFTLTTAGLGNLSLARSLALRHPPRVIGLKGTDIGVSLGEWVAQGALEVITAYAARACTSSTRIFNRDDMREAQAARGVASEDLRQRSGLTLGLGTSRSFLLVRNWANRLPLAERAARRFQAEPVAALRQSERVSAEIRGIDALDQVVGLDLTAAFAMGELAAHRRWSRAVEGNKIVIGVEASDPLAERTLGAFQDRPGATCVLVTSGSAPQHLAAGAAAVVSGGSAWDFWDIDFVVAPPPMTWNPSMPLPLWGAPPEAWAEWLCPSVSEGLLGMLTSAARVTADLS